MLLLNNLEDEKYLVRDINPAIKALFDNARDFSNSSANLLCGSAAFTIMQLFKNDEWFSLFNLALLAIFIGQIIFRRSTQNELSPAVSPKLFKQRLQRVAELDKQSEYKKDVMMFFTGVVTTCTTIGDLISPPIWTKLARNTLFFPSILFFLLYRLNLLLPDNHAKLEKMLCDNYARLSKEIQSLFERFKSPFLLFGNLNVNFDVAINSHSLSLNFTSQNRHFINFCRHHGMNENVKCALLEIFAEFFTKALPRTNVILGSDAIVIVLHAEFIAFTPENYEILETKLNALQQKLETLQTLYQHLNLTNTRITYESGNLQMDIPHNHKKNSLLLPFMQKHYLLCQTTKGAIIIRMKIDAPKYPSSNFLRRAARQRWSSLHRFPENFSRPAALAAKVSIDFGYYGRYDAITGSDRIKLLHGYDNVFIALDPQFEPDDRELLRKFSNFETNARRVYIQPGQKLKNGPDLFIKFNPSYSQNLFIGTKAFLKQEEDGTIYYLYILDQQIEDEDDIFEETGQLLYIPELESPPLAQPALSL
jgi:hypothetical protein